MFVAAMAGLFAALSLSWLAGKGRILSRLSNRSRQLLAGLAAVRAAQGDEVRQALLIRTGGDAIAFGLLGLLAMLALFAAIEALPFLLGWDVGLHCTYLASLSAVLVLRAMFERRRGR